MRSKLIRFAILIFALVSGATAQALSTGGEVVDVIDGKTITIATPNGKVKAQLQFIEVPEPEQPMYEAARLHLRQLIGGKVVGYRPFRYYGDRTVGRVTFNDVDVSQQMLRDGAAWHVPIRSAGQDANEHALYSSMEAAAKAEKRGVWSIDGLKPAWEFRAERDAARSQKQNTVTRASVKPKQPGYWGDVNPAIGDVGALSHGYNAAKRLGYVSTMMGGIDQTEDDKANNRVMGLEITYHYKEVPQEGRTGVFIITVVSSADAPRFAKNNDLVLMENKGIVIGKANRTVSADGDRILERLTYNVERSSIEKLVNGTANLSIGGHLVQPKNFAYSILHNMLQVSGKTQLASAAKPNR